jgi:serine protease Do
MRTALLVLSVATLAGCAAGAADTQAQTPPTAFNPMVSFAPLVKAVEPAVVNVYVTSRRTVNVPPQYQYFFGLPDQQERVQQGQGSGFVISPDGYILTNNHVAEGASEIKVKFADDGEYTATVVGTDPTSDVALLKIDAKKALPWLKLGDSERLAVGDWVLAAGNPLGLGHSVSAGIVSGKGRFIPDLPLDEFIQTDASINPGNSGGPLVGLDGTVVGMNTAIIQGANSVGFAIPSDHIQGVVQQLRDKGKVEHGYLGIEMAALTDAGKKQLSTEGGVLVTNVVADGPAEKAGLKPGDVIVNVADRPVNDSKALLRAVASQTPGEQVEIQVLRDGKARTVKVTLASRPAEPTN